MPTRTDIALQIFAALAEPATVDDGGGPVDLDHGAILKRGAQVFEGASVTEVDFISLNASDTAVSEFQRGDLIEFEDGSVFKLDHRAADDGAIEKFVVREQ
jgi:hypothetical protein